MKKLSSKFKNIVTLSLLVLCTFALAIAGVFGATKQSEMKTDGIQARAEMASYDKIGKIDYQGDELEVFPIEKNAGAEVVCELDKELSRNNKETHTHTGCDSCCDENTSLNNSSTVEDVVSGPVVSEDNEDCQKNEANGEIAGSKGLDCAEVNTISSAEKDNEQSAEPYAYTIKMSITYHYSTTTANANVYSNYTTVVDNYSDTCDSTRGQIRVTIRSAAPVSLNGYNLCCWNFYGTGCGGDSPGSTWLFDALETGAGYNPYAHYTVKTFKITYYLYSGTNHSSNPSTYTYGSAVTLYDASRTYYTFDGWYTSSSYTTALSITSTSYGAKSAHAKWTANTYEVWANCKYLNFSSGASNVNNGSNYTTDWRKFTASGTNSILVTLPTSPSGTVPTGASFNGWYYTGTTSSCGAFSDYTYDGGDAFYLTGALASDSDIDHYFWAYYTLSTYTITYTVTGTRTDTLTSPSSYTFGYGATITVPTATGYTCVASPSSISTTDTGDKTVTLTWTTNTYTVKYFDWSPTSGNYTSAMTTHTATYDASYTVRSTPGDWPAYTFQYWNFGDTNRNAGSSFKWQYTVDKNVYAVYDHDGYSISYTDTEGASMTYKPTSAYQDQTITVSNPSKEGWTFQGWNITNTCGSSYQVGGVSNGSLTGTYATTFYALRDDYWGGTVDFKATWHINKYFIEYDLNTPSGAYYDVVLSTTPPASANYDETFAISNPTLIGYTFSGWTISGMDNITHYRGSSSPASTSFTTTTGNKSTYYRNLHNGSITGEGITITFTAVWTEHSYSIVFDLDTLSGNTTYFPTRPYGNTVSFNGSDCDADYSDTITIHIPSSYGFRFDGWTISGMDTNHHSINGSSYSSASHDSTITDSTFSVRYLTATDGATVTFSARWTPFKCTISYDLDSGTLGDDYSSTSTNLGTNQPTSAEWQLGFEISNPTKLGYTFVSWTITGMTEGPYHFAASSLTNIDSTSDSMSTGTSMTLGPAFLAFMNLCQGSIAGSETVTFTANWRRNTYTVNIWIQTVMNEVSSQGYNLPTTSLTTYSAPVPDSGCSQTFNSSINKYVVSMHYDLGFTMANISSIGYVWNGWNLSGMDTNTHVIGGSNDSSSSLLTKATTFKNLTATDGGTITMNAVWTANTYTIAYDLKGYLEDETDAAPTPLNGFSYNCYKDVDKGEGALGTYAPTTATFDRTAQVSDPTRRGYTFRGWYATGLDTSDPFKHYHGQSLYSYAYEAGGTEFTADYLDWSYNSNDIFIYNFSEGDSLSAGASGKATITLIAIWNVNQYKIKYNWQGNLTTTGGACFDEELKEINKDGDLIPINSEDYPTNLTFDLPFYVPSMSKVGYTFMGWTISNMDTKGPHIYGGTLGKWTTDGTDKLTPGSTTQNATDSSITVTDFMNLQEADGAEVTFTAVWQVNSYSMTYDNNGYNVTAGSSRPTSANFDATFTVSTPTRIGYTFSHWVISGVDKWCHYINGNIVSNTTDGDSGEYSYPTTSSSTTFKNLRATSGTITFKACWTPNTYTINYYTTFKNEEGYVNNPSTYSNYLSETGPIFDQSYTFLDLSNERDIRTTPAGYKFFGWYVYSSSSVSYTYTFNTSTETMNNSYSLTIDGDVSSVPSTSLTSRAPYDGTVTWHHNANVYAFAVYIPIPVTVRFYHPGDASVDALAARMGYDISPGFDYNNVINHVDYYDDYIDVITYYQIPFVTPESSTNELRGSILRGWHYEPEPYPASTGIVLNPEDIDWNCGSTQNIAVSGRSIDDYDIVATGYAVYQLAFYRLHYYVASTSSTMNKLSSSNYTFHSTLDEYVILGGSTELLFFSDDTTANRNLNFYSQGMHIDAWYITPNKLSTYSSVVNLTSGATVDRFNANTVTGRPRNYNASCAGSVGEGYIPYNGYYNDIYTESDGVSEEGLIYFSGASGWFDTMMAGETISDGHGNEIVVYNYYAYAYYDYTVYKSHYYEIACEEFNYHTPESSDVTSDEACGECAPVDPSKGHFNLYPYTCLGGQTHEKVF
ncbi:MAG: InlB B-repeat-containing protein, partial [Clostridia bacterium]|nr:InlB B-repeat-containing protein [Clostridia bacterium]